MFSKETYQRRRETLRTLVKDGIILLLGNNDSPCNYSGNCYRFRQDSSFLYYLGLKRDGLAAVIDVESGTETLYGNDIDLDDIVWFGKTDSVADMAAQSGIAKSAPMADLEKAVDAARKAGRRIHFLPPYRYDLEIQLMDLLGIHPSQQVAHASMDLIMAVVKQRMSKEPQEIAEMEKACAIGYQMHLTAMRMMRPGNVEKVIAGTIDGIANAYGALSYPTILSQHGEIQHGVPSTRALEPGRLVVCDAGAETPEGYTSDHTRTSPVGGKFSQRQREIYSIVEACHDHVLEVARPGVAWFDVHMSVARLMTERLQALGLMKGDVDESVKAGAHALFFVHGLGHAMGLDVHDMESLGQTNLGFDEEYRPRLDQFGTKSLRFGRRLQENFVMSDEPGIYFIPALIEQWHADKHLEQFLNYDLIETYKDFGGVRIEDDVLITKDGCRFLGKDRIPYHPDEVEAVMAQD